MAQTKLNMLLQLRRDNVFNSTYVLQAGEPGFEVSTNTLKIGDGTKTWAQLAIANKEAIDALIKVVDDKVEALNDTYATDAEVEAVRAALAAAKLDKATYEAYIATRQLTDSEINTTIGNVGAKFASYRTSADQDTIDNAIKGRLDSLEAIDHEHTNKALLDTYAQTEANLADAVAKKHAHTFVEAELNKIVDGDVAKWNAVAADYLDSEDETALKNLIKEAKQAGTDANTALESYKVITDAAIDAVEEDIAEIVDTTNGILAQAKSYTDGKDSAMNTRVAALEAAAPTHALKSEVEAEFAKYNTTVAQKAIDDAQDAEIAKKVDKVEGKSLIADSEIARLATLANYDDTQVKADIAKKADTETVTTELGKKVDKVDGYSLVSDTEIARLAEVDNYDDTALTGRVTDAEGKITALETESAKHALKSDVEAEFAKYTKTADLPTDLGDFTNNAGYAKTTDVNAELNKKADKTQVATDIANAIAPLATTEALNGVKATADAAAVKTEVEAALALKADKSVVDAMYTNTQIDGFVADAKSYADGLITEANLDQYTTEQEVKDIVDGVIAAAADSETYNSLSKLVDYIDTHGGEASTMAEAISALEDQVEVIEGKPAYGITADQISNWDNEVGAKALANTKLDESTFTAYSNAHAGDYTNAQIDAAIDADVAAAKSELEGKINAINTGVMSVEAGEDIVVTPGENGKVTVAHETFTTGAYTKDPASSDKTGDVYMMTSVTVDNGHVTGANVQSLASVLEGMTFVFDGGNSSNV